MGAIAPPPIPRVAPKFFRAIKLLMCKPKQYFSANHRKCLRNLLHNFVEPGESTKVHQLSVINPIQEVIKRQLQRNDTRWATI